MKRIAIVKQVACDACRVSIDEVMSSARHQRIVRCRHLVIWLLYEMTALSTPEIASEVGRSDHTTVIHGIRTVTRRRRDDPEWREWSDGLVRLIRKRIDETITAPDRTKVGKAQRQLWAACDSTILLGKNVLTDKEAVAVASDWTAQAIRIDKLTAALAKAKDAHRKACRREAQLASALAKATSANENTNGPAIGHRRKWRINKSAVRRALAAQT